MKTALYSLLLASALSSTLVWADDDNYSNYEAIVDELRTAVVPEKEYSNDPWEQVNIYAGLGVATSLISAEIPDAKKVSGMLKGIEAHFGIDMFTKILRTEGAFRAFAQESFDNRSHASLKEFELRGVFIPAPLEKNIIRMGLGITARYLDVRTTNSQGDMINYEAKTPSSLIFIGLQRKIGKNVAFGPDIAYRSALIDETFDKSSLDFCLKMDAHF